MVSPFQAKASKVSYTLSPTQEDCVVGHNWSGLSSVCQVAEASHVFVHRWHFKLHRIKRAAEVTVLSRVWAVGSEWHRKPKDAVVSCK